MRRYQVTTLGTEVYDSETGPTTGYDNVRTYVAEFATDDDAADYFASRAESIRSMVPLDNPARSLSRGITMAHEIPPIERNVPAWHGVPDPRFGDCYCDSVYHPNGKCRRPEGTNAPATVYCPNCEGTGIVIRFAIVTECERCLGSGKLPK